MSTLLSVQPDAIPEAMRLERRWVVWRLVPRHSKLTKVPYRAADCKLEAKSTDPATWADFDEAMCTYLLRQMDGIGFVLGDGWVGFDQDDTLDLEYLRVLNTYTERSPSGRGAHAIARGSKPGTRCRTGAFELYAEGRYFTVTGHRIEGFPATAEERTPEIAVLYSRLFGADEHEPPEPNAEPREAIGSEDDEELLIQMAGADNGDKFVRLWYGDPTLWEKNHPNRLYPSHSEADSALLCMLAFWTGGDRERMDRLFRRSGLYREGRWGARRGNSTWGAQMIENALRVPTIPSPRGAVTSRLHGLSSGLQGLRGL